jgi:hypothetical protein
VGLTVAEKKLEQTMTMPLHLFPCVFTAPDEVA